MAECDGKSQAHDVKPIKENKDASRVICTICYKQFIMRKDRDGKMEKRLLARVFKRDLLQPSGNLFHKYHPQFMKT